MKKDIKFAAFIMTYKRVSILETTIIKLLSQTYPPQKIVVVDNDPEQSASIVISKFPNHLISYHAVGYNSGPAGAANAGLGVLIKEGYEWIGWMDDDDPPVFENTFEILLQTAVANENCGCVGTVGQYFNKKNGLMVRVADSKLEGSGSLVVDNIAGGMCKIVNAAVCTKANVFPDTSLFYGFEELDFDIRLQRAGYVLLTDKELYKKHRVYYNRVGLQYVRGLKKDMNRLWRDYYSTRNSLIILWNNGYYQALIISFFRFSLKLFTSFRYGLQYGILTCHMIIKAIFHFFIGKRGSILIK